MIEKALLENAESVSLSSLAQERLVRDAGNEWIRFTQQTQALRDQSSEAWQLYLDSVVTR